MTLIPADNHFALMAALFVIAGAAFLAERRVWVASDRCGDRQTAIAAANLKIIPHSAPAFDFDSAISCRC